MGQECRKSVVPEGALTQACGPQRSSSVWSGGHDEPLSLEEGHWVREKPAGRGASSVALPLMLLSVLVAVSTQIPSTL